MNFDPNRLKVALLNTGLQNKDTPLYQVISQIIDALSKLSLDANETGSLIINNIAASISEAPRIGPPGMDGFDRLEETFYILGSQSSGSTGGGIRTYDSPLTNGDGTNPELIWTDDGDVIIAQVPY